MELICKSCGVCQSTLEAKIEKHYLPNGGYHIKAHCFECGTFIKNMPHSLPRILHFGKYKGKSIAEVAKENPAYLVWLVGRDIRDNLKHAIQFELEKLQDEHLQNSINLS